MRKGLLLLVLAIVCGMAGRAESVSRTEALQKAKAFMQGKGIGVSRQMTEVARAPRKKAGQTSAPCYYVFNADRGFVIVSGDDRTVPVLGYSLSGNFNPDSIPANMRAWLQGYADLIDNLDSLGVTAKYDEADATVPAKAFKSADGRLSEVPVLRAGRIVQPLLTSTWNQDAPYWDNCPLQNYNGSYYNTYTGCVATAMAQVVNYHKYPEATTTDMPSYITSTYKIEVSGVPAGSVIDWANMADDYTNYKYMTTESKQAVANLMRYCGVSLEMDYTCFSSGAMTANVAMALKKYFGYDENIYHADRMSYTIATWDALLCNELVNNRPVVYHGQSTGGGHAFVLDGYDGELYHVNWGWGGACDGYFAVSVLNPNSTAGIGASSTPDGYSMGQGAIIGVQPPGYPNPVGPNNFDKMMTSMLSVDSTNIIFEIYNMTGQTNTFDVGLMLKDMTTGSETVMPLINDVEVGPNYGWSGVKIDANGFLGTFKVYPVSRISGTEEWLYDHDPERVYAFVVTDESGIQTLELHPIANLEASDFVLPSNPSVGKAQVIETTVKNNGEEFNGNLYFFQLVDGEEEYELFGRTGVVIPQGGEVNTVIYITPRVNKNHHIYVAVDKNNDGEVNFNTEVIGECLLTFDGEAPVVDLEVVSAGIYNEPIAGEDFDFYVSIKNNGDDYSGPLYLFYVSERMYEEENLIYRGMHYDKVSIAAGETADVDFSFLPDETGNYYFWIGTDSEAQNIIAQYSVTVGERIPDVDGDINGDGRLDVADLVALSKYISDGDFSNVQVDKADLTGDGRITVADVVELARRIANQ